MSHLYRGSCRRGHRRARGGSCARPNPAPRQTLVGAL